MNFYDKMVEEGADERNVDDANYADIQTQLRNIDDAAEAFRFTQQAQCKKT